MGSNPVTRTIIVVALSSVCIFVYIHLIDSGRSQLVSGVSAFGLLVGMVAVVYLAETRSRNKRGS